MSLNGAACVPDGECAAARDNAFRVKPWFLTRGKASLSNPSLVIELMDVQLSPWIVARLPGGFGNPR